jgi:hypothetical protein
MGDAGLRFLKAPTARVPCRQRHPAREIIMEMERPSHKADGDGFHLTDHYHFIYICYINH